MKTNRSIRYKSPTTGLFRSFIFGTQDNSNNMLVQEVGAVDDGSTQVFTIGNYPGTKKIVDIISASGGGFLLRRL